MRPILERIRQQLEYPPPVLTYPDQRPWLWTGALSSNKKDRPVYKKWADTTRKKDYVQPRISYRSKSTPVVRILYQELVAPLGEDEKLVNVVGNLRDVNPVAYVVKNKKRIYKLHWEEPVTVTEEMQEICEMLEGEFALRPFTSLSEIRERFDFVFDDVSDEDLILALETTGLIKQVQVNND